MTAKECITTRRSVRKFKADPVSHELLNSIVETASFAPSWKNTQITRYTVVEDSALKAELAAKATILHNADIINGAPALVVATLIKNRCGFERDGSYTTTKGDHWQMFDAGVAVQTFCLAAWEQGIGSVIMGIFDEKTIEDLLAVPEDQEVAALIAIGYPDETPNAPARKSTDILLQYK
ncbi:MAG: nitroreductase family protein [Clostridium sp.]|nr:nitroreductase family protein [Clostridium sp.]